MANTNLAAAGAAKNDEFYTQHHDIEAEMNAYLDYDPDVFRGKTVLLPCDDPEWSSFTRYFAARFRALGVKRLISTSYAPESKRYRGPWQPTIFETRSPRFRPEWSRLQGKIFTLDRDANGDGRIDIDDLQWDYLEGDGDFRSGEVTALRDGADIIITNPPFSLFPEFLAWAVAGGAAARRDWAHQRNHVQGGVPADPREQAVAGGLPLQPGHVLPGAGKLSVCLYVSV